MVQRVCSGTSEMHWEPTASSQSHSTSTGVPGHAFTRGTARIQSAFYAVNPFGVRDGRRTRRLFVRQQIPAAGGLGLQLRRGERLRIIDPQGGQSGDLVAFSQDGRQRLSNGRTFDYVGKIY